jgi:diguanylate cyclase (GGDEF)-like protein
VLLPQSTAEDAGAAAERLRRAVAGARIALPGGELAVTLSGGVASYPGDGLNWDALYAVADGRLYEAKRAGRDRVLGAARAQYTNLSTETQT